MKLFLLNGLPIRYKMYLRFYIQTGASDLSQRVSRALQLYNQSLDTADHFRRFGNGISDAVDAGKLALNDQARLEIEQTISQVKSVMILDTTPTWNEVLQALQSVQSAASKTEALKALIPLKDQINFVNRSLSQASEDYKKQLTDLSLKINEQQQHDAIRRQVSAVVTLTTLLFLGYLIKRSIDAVAKPIVMAVSAARRVAQGDLTGHIHVKGESDELSGLQLALRDMNRSLTKIVSEVRRVSQDVSTRTQSIAFSNRDMSGQMKTQAANLATTTQRIKSMLRAVTASANSAKEANELAHGAAKVADKGGQMVQEVTRTMMSIKESSEKVVNIIGIIEDIAFQTNLLALNAAVEAARAGEQGRGFAVVAAEVGNLAQRSATTAKEIRDIIGNSVTKVKAGAELVQTTGITMQELVAAVSRVATVIEQVEKTSHQQTGEAEHANRALADVEDAMHKNSKLVENTAALTNSMLMRTAQLSAAVSKFKLYRHRRLTVPWHARITEKGLSVAEGAVKNMSATGAFIETNATLDAGGKYKLEINSTEFVGREIQLECEIVRVSIPEGGANGYGLHFMRIRKGDKSVLKEQVSRLLSGQHDQGISQQDVNDSSDAIMDMDEM